MPSQEAMPPDWQEKRTSPEQPARPSKTYLLDGYPRSEARPSTYKKWLFRQCRRNRRIMVLVVALTLLLACSTAFWSSTVQMRILEHGFLRWNDENHNLRQHDRTAEFGHVRIKPLDPHLLPGGEYDPDGKRRLIFIGDVHGCKDELLKLLRKAHFDTTLDHLVFTGDVISKGPDNIEVLDKLIKVGATSVRGNHEDHILMLSKTTLDIHESQDQIPSDTGAAKDTKLLRRLKPRHLEYLRRMPLILQIPALPQARASTAKIVSPIVEQVLVAHAGIVPDVPLAHQDPYFVMNMRSIHAKTHKPSASRADKVGNEKPWIDAWGSYNDQLFKGPRRAKTLEENSDELDIPVKHQSWLSSIRERLSSGSKSHPKPQVVIYGHDSHAGLQIRRWSKGLDSACVAGGELTALILDAGGETKTVSVGCKNYKA